MKSNCGSFDQNDADEDDEALREGGGLRKGAGKKRDRTGEKKGREDRKRGFSTDISNDEERVQSAGMKKLKQEKINCT